MRMIIAAAILSFAFLNSNAVMAQFPSPQNNPVLIPPMLQFDVDNDNDADWDDIYAVWYHYTGFRLLPFAQDGNVDLSEGFFGIVNFDDVIAVDAYIVTYDLNRDRSVDTSDIVFLTNYVGNGGGPNTRFDFNRDGVVSNIDIQIFEQSIGRSPYQNFQTSRFDVNNDGLVTSADAQEVINYLNSNGSSGGNLVGVVPKSRAKFYDVNGDKKVSALDALQIINAL